MRRMLAGMEVSAGFRWVGEVQRGATAFVVRAARALNVDWLVPGGKTRLLECLGERGWKEIKRK